MSKQEWVFTRTVTFDNLEEYFKFHAKLSELKELEDELKVETIIKSKKRAECKITCYSEKDLQHLKKQFDEQ